MKMLDKIDIAIKMSSENLKEERNNLIDYLKNGKFKSSFHRAKYEKRLERLENRISENANAMKLMAIENYNLFSQVYNAMQKNERTIHHILTKTREKINNLNDENAYFILKLINTELIKRRKTKIFYLINYTWHLLPRDFYDGYKIKTKRFNDLILDVFKNYPIIEGFKYKYAEDTDSLYSYIQDIRHYIESCPLSKLRIGSKRILEEYVETYFETISTNEDYNSYDELLDIYLK